MSGLRREFLWYNLIELLFQVKSQFADAHVSKKTRKIYFEINDDRHIGICEEENEHEI